jgi:hypothetical protein
MANLPFDMSSGSYSGKVSRQSQIENFLRLSREGNPSANIEFSEGCTNGSVMLSIEIDSGYSFVSTESLSRGYELWSQCGPIELIEIPGLPIGETVSVSGIIRDPLISRGDGTQSWERGSCGEENVPADTSIYFFYDITSMPASLLLTAARAAKAWADSLPNFTGQVFHIQIQGERWVQWAEVPKTGMFGGLFGDRQSVTGNIGGTLVSLGNIVSYSGNGTTANPFNYNLELSASNYPTNELGYLWTDQEITNGTSPIQVLNPGVVYTELQSTGKDVVVVAIVDESHANVRRRPNTPQEGWADYHGKGAGNSLTPTSIGITTKINWGNDGEVSGYPNTGLVIGSDNLNTVHGSISNAALTYTSGSTSYTSASTIYENKLKYFEGWKQAAFYTGTDPYNGSIRPTQMGDELQFNGGLHATASWQRDYKRFRMIHESYIQGPTASSYAQDVADGHLVSFIVYATRPSVPEPQHIAFPLHVVGAITDNATYIDSSGVSVTTTDGLIEDSNLPYSGLWDEFSSGAINTLLPISYVGAGHANNGRNPYYEYELGRLSSYNWGYNIDQNVSPLDQASWEIKFTDDLSILLDTAATCNSTDCIRILVVDELTGAPIPNFQINVPQLPNSNIITDETGQIWVNGLPEGAYDIMSCFGVNMGGKCEEWSMKLLVSSTNHTISSNCKLGCTDNTACNYDPEAGVDDESCVYTDCNGDCDGSAFLDSCGECVEGLTGVPEGITLDDCEECGGNNLSKDICGECYGDGSSCSGCTDPLANNYNPNAVIDNGTCECTITYYECILKEMAKKIVLDCSEECYGKNCDDPTDQLYANFRTLDSLLTMLKAYNATNCGAGSETTLREILDALPLLVDGWECSTCKNC